MSERMARSVGHELVKELEQELMATRTKIQTLKNARVLRAEGSDAASSDVQVQYILKEIKSAKGRVRELKMAQTALERPPSETDIDVDEVEAGNAFLRQQIDAIKDKLETVKREQVYDLSTIASENEHLRTQISHFQNEVNAARLMNEREELKVLLLDLDIHLGFLQEQLGNFPHDRSVYAMLEAKLRRIESDVLRLKEAVEAC